jgi:AmmeMemoRadiSam system protein B
MVRGRWRLPGGELPIAEALARSIISASRVLEDDELAHEREHAMSAAAISETPPASSFVPITLMGTISHSARRWSAVAARSSPPNPPSWSARLISTTTSPRGSEPGDRLAIDALLSLDPERLRETVKSHQISMCGLAPALATLAALRRLGGGRAELVSYETSEGVSGDYDRVVGYAGLVIHQPDER